MTQRGGYGLLRVGKRKVPVHRVSYELHNDCALPPHSARSRADDICVLHRCDHRICVNPDHLFLGTRKDNADDRDRKGRHAGARCAKKGEENGIAFLTEEIVREMRLRWDRNEFETYVQLGDAYGTVPENASMIVRRVAWKHVI
jgi:hypothetical protein